MAHLVRLTAQHFDSLAVERGIRFSVDVQDALRGQIDPEKFQRVLVNLFSNAFKFTPAGGQIRCTLRASHEDILLEVADSGPGVPPDQRETVFERFRQIDGGPSRRHGGTGLGLAIARDFVALHGGRISFGEAAEGGALLSVRLPVRAPKGSAVAVLAPEDAFIAETVANAIAEFGAAAEAAGGEPAVDARDGRALVLVVEDNPEMNRFVRDVLSGGVPEPRAPRTVKKVSGWRST